MTAVSACEANLEHSVCLPSTGSLSLDLELSSSMTDSAFGGYGTDLSAQAPRDHRSCPTPPTCKSRQANWARADAELGRFGEREDAFSPRPIRVFCMLPLDVVNAEGVFRPAPWFVQALRLLADTGAHGVAVDVWWGAVEREPRQFNWAGYRQLFQLVRSTGLKLQVVMSFHACGGNVGDVVQIPLPRWVLQAGEHDPDLFFTDRPRDNGLGQRNKEYISIWADEAAGVLCGRSPLQCYEDFMVAFRDAFQPELGSLIEEVVVGAGPCGELRFPSYVEANGWRFPGVGEFQCYDRRALASLAAAAQATGHPEWGYAGPHDSGHYNCSPEDTGFFSSEVGSWDIPYGRFFLDWYSDCLLRHGERILASAERVFGAFMAPASDASGASKPHRSDSVASMNFIESCGNLIAAFLSAQRDNSAHASEASEVEPEPLPEFNPPVWSVPPPLADSASMPDVRSGAFVPSRFHRSNSTFAESSDGGNTLLCMAPCNSLSSLSTEGNTILPGFDAADDTDVALSSPDDADELCLSRQLADLQQSVAARVRSGSATGVSGQHVCLTLKIAGIHWWYRSRSHAAELTAGYYNTDTRDGYRPIIELCAKHRSSLTLTCVEMCDAQHPTGAMCGPEGLLQQIRGKASRLNVPLSGENALPIFMDHGVDTVALERIVANTRAWHAKQAAYGTSTCATAPAVGNIVSTCRQLSESARPVVAIKDGVVARAEQGLCEPLPAMKSFTFLRLGPEILKAGYLMPWVRFLQKMQGGGYC